MYLRIHGDADSVAKLVGRAVAEYRVVFRGERGPKWRIRLLNTIGAIQRTIAVQRVYLISA